ncbi:MAG: zinc ribbon domain-containing protein [Clostridia bacterium]|nr:zinc ribbon domain-containing protein [Clostridia bacterium]
MMFCKHCGQKLEENAVFCGACGKRQDVTIIDSQPNQSANAGSVAAFVVGLIAAIFGLFGGLCVSACYGVGGQDGTPLLMLVGGSMLGLVGACVSLKNARPGALMELGAAVVMAICAFGITGADFMSLVAIALFLVGGLVGFFTAKK